jgi:hypothetical protein
LAHSLLGTCHRHGLSEFISAQSWAEKTASTA